MAKDDKQISEAKAPVVCGLIMPISASDGLEASHWLDVKDIVTSAIEDAGFAANLVSEGDDTSIIHKRIIQNIYQYPIVICDVSSRNPNVMFELGMRLGFDKPTIVIKDDVTVYPFDTSPLEYISYPRDLRFASIVTFKNQLTSKLKATYRKSQEETDYSSYLGHLGQFKVAKLDTKEVSETELIADQMAAVKQEVRNLSRAFRASLDGTSHLRRAKIRITVHARKDDADAVMFWIANIPGSANVHASFQYEDVTVVVATVSGMSETALNQFLMSNPAPAGVQHWSLEEL